MPTNQVHQCFECGRKFSRDWNLKRHCEDIHKYPNIQNMLSDHYIGLNNENYRNKKQAQEVFFNKTDFCEENYNTLRQRNTCFPNDLIYPYQDNNSYSTYSSPEYDYKKSFKIPIFDQERENYQKEREKVCHSLLVLRVNQRLFFLSQYNYKDNYRMGFALYYLGRYCISGGSTEPIDNLLKNLGLYGEFQRRFFILQVNTLIQFKSLVLY